MLKLIGFRCKSHCMNDASDTAEEQDTSLFPLEFHVVGTPLSLQASNASKEKWKRTVAMTARQRAELTTELVWLEEAPVAVTIFYFPIAPMAGDIDNIVKPILDALSGQAYTDDKLVERVVSQKFEPDTGWSFGSPTDQLTAALDAISSNEGPQPIVYIRIDDDLSWRAQP